MIVIGVLVRQLQLVIGPRFPYRCAGGALGAALSLGGAGAAPVSSLLRRVIRRSSGGVLHQFPIANLFGADPGVVGRSSGGVRMLGETVLVGLFVGCFAF